MANDDTGERTGTDERVDEPADGEFGYDEREDDRADSDVGAERDDRSGPTPGPQPDGEPIAPDRERGRRGDRGGSRERPATDRRRTGRIASGVAALLGAWVAVSAFGYGMGAAALWNNVLVGAVIFLGAGYEYYRGLTGHPPTLGVAGLVALLGIWLIVAVAALGLAGGAAWSTAVAGLLVAVLSGYVLYESREARADLAGEAGVR
ncbi:SPW repeat protein [Saliphagus infecundisoli]|uniref:SPW repeat protein n=1 Tax=Saliphagus infecundisoli TaxID=1849069 RepID=A0ABD5QER6_9EURY|nr:SPW repeat protein [Saliphagus infecundisoli]